MGFFASLLYDIKEYKCNPFKLTHHLLYAATATYVGLLQKLVKIPCEPLRKHISETYHCKVMRLADATRFITINKNVTLKNLDQVIPFKHAKDIVLKNPGNIVAYECACRAQKKDACRPTDVCIVVGEPFVDLIRAFQPFRSRRISPDEALRILQEEDERGHFHTAWFKTAMLDRFYAICNCCKCCCTGMKFLRAYGMQSLLPSGYRATIGPDCIGCGACADACPFDAVEIINHPQNRKANRCCEVIADRCYGCGICEGRCPRQAITLIPDPDKGIPLNIEVLDIASNPENLPPASAGIES